MAPITSISTSFLATAVAFELDFRKNLEPDLVARFGPPIVAIPDLDPSLQLQVEIGTSNSQVDMGLRVALDMFQGQNGQHQVVGLVGEYHSSISMPVSSLTTIFQIPQVSFASTSPALSNKVAYPWFLRTIPPDSIQGGGMWRFIDHFLVQAATVVYALEPYGEGLYQAVSDAAAGANQTFRVAGVGVMYMPGTGMYSPAEAREKIRRVKGVGNKVVFVCMTTDQGREFFPVALEEGILSGGWQVVGSEALALMTSPEILPVGYMLFSPNNEGPLFQQFDAMWRQLQVDDVLGPSARSRYNIDRFKVKIEDARVPPITSATFSDSSAMVMECPFLFDAAYTFVYAINNLLKGGVPIESISGKLLLDAVKKVQFEGISGRVAFNAQGDRLASYTIFNIQGDINSIGSKAQVPAATYSAATGQITIDSLSGLQWMDGKWSRTIPESLIACSPGKFSDSSTRMCTSCAANSYSVGGANAVCQACPTGKYQDEPGQSACKFVELVLGIYGPFTSTYPEFVALAVAFDLDFRKNFEPALVERFGPPVIKVNNLNPNLRIAVQLGNSNSDPKVGVKMALDMFQGMNGYDKVVGLVGGYHSSISVQVAPLATQFKVPQVAWGSTSPRLSDKASYPWFLRTIPPDSIQGGGMWKLIQTFLIPSATFVYALEAYGEGLFQAIGDAASADGQGIRVAGVGVPYMPGDGAYNPEEARDKIKRVKALTSKVVFMAMTVDQGKGFLPVAAEEGLVSTSWQLIGSEALPFNSMSVIGSMVPVGYMFFEPVSRGRLWAQMEAMWRNLTVDDVIGPDAQARYKMQLFTPLLGQGRAPLPTEQLFSDPSTMQMEGPFLIDAAYTFVSAFNALMNRNVASQDISGQLLLDAVKVVQFEGVSGHVVFNQVGDRAASYLIVNVQRAPVSAQVGAPNTTAKVARQVAVYSAASGRITTENGTDMYWMTLETGWHVPDTLVGCDAGFWKDLVGETPTRMCFACEPGTISSGGSTPQCSACPAGTTANTDRGATSCVECQAGSYSAESKSTACQPCEAGLFASVPGGTQCKACPVGQYAGEIGSTSCISCSTGKQRPKMYATLQQIEVSGTKRWVPLMGATKAAQCGCSEGAYEERGECTECGQGMICPGMGEVLLRIGYFSPSDRPGFVFQCFGTNFPRCPGGVPGLCARGRMNSSIACTRCELGWRASDSGECKTCGGADALPTILVIVVVVTFLVGTYRINDTDNPAGRNRSILLVSIAGSQMLTLFQQLAVFGLIALDWPRPFKDLLDMVAVLNFNLDFFNLDCVAPVGPLAKFGGRVFAVLVFFVAMLLIHIIYVRVLFKGAYWERIASLVSATGTLFMAFFTSVVSSMLAPFQCNTHPNGLRTVREYPEVICFDTTYGNIHLQMMVLGIVSTLIPLSFLVWAALAVRRYPSAIAAGNTNFLHSYAFLFSRFRPGAHRFIIVFLVRNMCITIIPALGSPALQILLLQGILMPLFAVTLYFQPWAVHIANLLDAANSAFMCMILLCFALFVPNVDSSFVATVCCVLTGIALAGILLALSSGMYERFLRKGKPYQYFLCHHKAGAGNFVRLLKIFLTESPGVMRKVFVDSDDLSDLGRLFSIVGADVEQLVVVCSKDIISRPWCMGEVTVAHINKVPVVKVLMPEFGWPEEDFINSYASHVPDLNALVPYGIATQDMQAAIRWMGKQPGIIFTEEVSLGAVKGLVATLLQSRRFKAESTVQVESDAYVFDSPDAVSKLDTARSVVSSTKSTADSASTPRDHSRLKSYFSRHGSMVGAERINSIRDLSGMRGKIKNYILADFRNMEMSSTALVLHKLLSRTLYTTPESVPVVLEKDSLLPEGAEQLCLICNNGVFKAYNVVITLLRAAELEVGVLPILAEANFRFPTKEFIPEIEAGASQLLAKVGSVYTARSFISVLDLVFREIAVEVNAQDAEDVLRVRAQAVANRLNAKGGLRKLVLKRDASQMSADAPPSSPSRTPDEEDATPKASLSAFTSTGSPMALDGENRSRRSERSFGTLALQEESPKAMSFEEVGLRIKMRM